MLVEDTVAVFATGRERAAALATLALLASLLVTGSSTSQGRSQDVETHCGARDADKLAKLGRKPVLNEDTQRLPRSGDVAQLLEELVDVEQARVGVQEREQDGALGEVVIGHVAELMRTSVRRVWSWTF